MSHGRATTALPCPPNAEMFASTPRQNLPSAELIVPELSIDHIWPGAAVQRPATSAPFATTGGAGGGGGLGFGCGDVHGSE